jgi:hypothetical protein
MNDISRHILIMASPMYVRRGLLFSDSKEYGTRHFALPAEKAGDQVCVTRLLGSSGFAGPFKTASNLCVACGLIFKGLIGCFSMITHIQPCGVNP